MTTNLLEKLQSSPPIGTSLTRDGLHDRTTALHVLIKQEQLARASATLDGQAYDPAPLRAAEEELAALEGAEGELARRHRAEAAASASAIRSEQVARVQVVIKDWLAGIDDQEAAARAMIEAMKQADTARAELQALVSKLLGSVPVLLFSSEQETRRSYGLGALLQAHYKTGRFGEVVLPQGQLASDEAWSAAERRLTETITLQISEQ